MVLLAEKKERIPVAPEAVFYHDTETYTLVVELPGVNKEDIELKAMENGFCLTAPRDDIVYRGYWVLMLRPIRKKQRRRSRMDFKGDHTIS